MGRFTRNNPQKKWECDACGRIVKGYAIDKRGGFCSSCGNDTFAEVDRDVSALLWKRE